MQQNYERFNRLADNYQAELYLQTTGVQLNRLKMLVEEFGKILKAQGNRPIVMGDWCSLEYAENEEAAKVAIKDAVDNPCGTAACLAGKAGLMPRFRALGFKWIMTFQAPSSYAREYEPDGHYSGEFEYREFKSEEAVKQFFGIDAYDELFMDFSIKSVKGGIYRLKQFINRIEKARRV